MRTNFVIATWGGERYSTSLCPQINAKAIADRTWYLQTLLAQLKSLKHSMTQITIVANPAADEPEYFTKYLQNCWDAVVLRRGVNEGMSYGAYVHAYEKFAGQFDYWFFFEDDYLPMVDDFDQIFIKRFESFSDCGWMRAGGAEVGITSGKVLEKISTAYGGGIPVAPQNNFVSQVRWVQNFEGTGHTVRDMIQLGDIGLSAGYWHHHGNIWMYGKQTDPPIILPVQALDPAVPRSWVSAGHHT